MKYYEMHEIVYQGLKEKEKLSWDQSTTFEEMWAHETNLNISKNLFRMGLSFKGLNVLDLGTGTGTSALYAAKEGAKAVGVEISQTAIAIAHKNAKTINVETEFIVADILSLNLERQFDLVIDSTVLHCIVGNEDRKKFYDVCKKHLSANGYLFINTMISSGDMTEKFPKEFFLVEDYVLWSMGMSAVSDRKIINGKSYFPHRTLFLKEMLFEEFSNNGFVVEHLEVTSETDVKCLTGFLKLKSFQN
jgi:2-polyprenyl-3-methyl-5-hydroxy-6-metoxy-1,4-benzoquinol methylase